MKRFCLVASFVLASAITSACGSDTPKEESGPVTIKLLSTSERVLPESVREFTARTGITVELIDAGDAGTMVSKAILSAGNPEGDVLWGVDNTQLSLIASGDGTKVFADYTPTDLKALDPASVAQIPGARLTPVDTGDICLNVDSGWFATRSLTPPATFVDLLETEYADLLVVPDPRTSTPGLGFMLATVGALGEPSAQEYWAALAENGVKVVDSWSTAYFTDFTAGGGGGERPIVVSYASSPPYGLQPGQPAQTAALLETCFRQVEFAGVLRGTKHETAARAFIDFMLSAEFQAQLPETNYVYPVRSGVALPQTFVEHGQPATKPWGVSADDLAKSRERWTEQWTSATAG